MQFKEIKTDAKRVIITRALLADGYNYYLSLYTNLYGCEILNGSYKQTNSILSAKEAIKQAKQLIQ